MLLRRNPPPQDPHMTDAPHIASHPDVIASRRATAIAEVQKMQQDLILAHDEVASLKKDLDRLQDRIELVLDERNKYRTEAHVFRHKLIELATQMANINLMTTKANEIVMTVGTLLAEEQSHEESTQEQETARTLVEGLSRINGSQEPSAPEVLPPRNPPEGGGLPHSRLDHDERQPS